MIIITSVYDNQFVACRAHAASTNEPPSHQSAPYKLALYRQEPRKLAQETGEPSLPTCKLAVILGDNVCSFVFPFFPPHTRPIPYPTTSCSAAHVTLSGGKHLPPLPPPQLRSCAWHPPRCVWLNEPWGAHGKDNGFYSKKHPAEHELTGVAHVLTRLAHVLILFGGLMAIAWCALVVRNPSISTLLAAPVTSNPAGGTGSIWSLGRNSRRISGGGAVDIPAMASSSSGGGGGGAHQEYIAPSSIPGSRLTSADADLAFRRGFECVNERGTWQFDSTPRLLPWAVAGQHGGWQCDQPWLRENRARHTPQPSPEAAAPSAGANPPVAASASADLASSTQALAPPSAPSPPLRRLLSVDAFPSTTPSGGADDEAALPEDEEDTAETAAVDATRAAKAAPIAVAVASNGVAPLPALKTASSAPRSIAFAGETADGNSSSSSSSDGGGGGGGGSSSRYKHVAYAAADRVVMEGRGAEEWQVRPAVKYRWRLPARGAEGGCGVAWRDVECAQLAAGLTNGRGKILMVGDSLTSLAFLSFRNHMRMCAAAASAGARATHAGDTGNASTMGRNSRTSSNEGNGGSGEPLPAAPQSLVPPLPAKIEEAKLAVCAAEVRQSVMRNMHGHMLCDSVSYGNTTVATVRNDVLHTNSTRHLDFPRMVSFPWFDDVLPESDTAVLVLNRGAHYVEDEEFTEQLNRTLTRVREVAPELLIIYRSTSPGHAHCENITAPLKEPQDPASLPFHWGEFGRQNKLARQMVEAVGGVFMDVDPMTSLRGDGHMMPPSDCLHYCLPGPLDVWTQLLYNMLLHLL
ncbi:unnamed protein product [Closterium sp. NIES-65]|nr:unnamed protein product [Closterium sp. NIES-65]